MDAAQDAKTRILECSRDLFSTHTFAGVSLKDIAQAADVSPPLIIKHFINKENLFEKTLDFTPSAAALFSGPFHSLGETSIRETLTAPVTASYSMIRTLSITDGSEGSLSAIGKRIKEDILQSLTKRIQREAPFPFPSPELRAQAAVSLLTGVSLMRRVGDTEFTQFDSEQLVSYYSVLLQSIIDGSNEPPQ
ncbi:TetR/AcrR family transcriptional regulator [Corynebacterium freiburgense]|uniref:TetR/AcrR family transcriptional regulator n=1 Tax=Corynebacterium freiburgense TaxID=556548 RepID=UPI00041A7C32|nr:TetR/AcrR family transcriptional regulator [Corynebacterium freiburgense]WJZ02315.1 DNA-binding transcriptional repressor AcrR [Corynebacterium freiburgense]